MKTLADLEPGHWGVIVKVGGERDLRLRLMQLGLLAGEQIQMVRCAPFGDPLEIALRGSHLSLRRENAREILVEPLPGPSVPQE